MGLYDLDSSKDYRGAITISLALRESKKGLGIAPCLGLAPFFVEHTATARPTEIWGVVRSRGEPE